MMISICTTTARCGFVEYQAKIIADQKSKEYDLEWVLVDFAYEERKESLKKIAQELGLHIVHLPNVTGEEKFYRDITRNRNKALKYANGDYIIFLDDYAIISKDFVKDHLSILSKGALSAGNMFRLEQQIDYKDIIDVSTEDVLKTYSPYIGKDWRYVQNGVPRLMPYKGIGISYTGNLGIPRNIFEHLNGFDPRMESGLEDCDFGTRAHIAGFACYFNPKAFTVNLYVSHIPYTFSFDHTHDVEPFISNPNNHFWGNAELEQNEFMTVEFCDHYRVAHCKKCGAKGMIDPNELIAYKLETKEFCVPANLPGGLDTLRKADL